MTTLTKWLRRRLLNDPFNYQFVSFDSIQFIYCDKQVYLFIILLPFVFKNHLLGGGA